MSNSNISTQALRNCVSSIAGSLSSSHSSLVALNGEITAIHALHGYLKAWNGKELESERVTTVDSTQTPHIEKTIKTIAVVSGGDSVPDAVSKFKKNYTTFNKCVKSIIVLIREANSAADVVDKNIEKILDAMLAELLGLKDPILGLQKFAKTFGFGANNPTPFGPNSTGSNGTGPGPGPGPGPGTNSTGSNGTEPGPGPGPNITVPNDTRPNTEPKDDPKSPDTKPKDDPEPRSITPQTSTPKTSAPTTSAPKASAPETSAPKISAPKTSAPETSAPKTSAPKTSAPETSAPKTSAPETSAPKTSAPETSAPETSAPETSAPETSAPETSAPVVPVAPPVAPPVEATTEYAPIPNTGIDNKSSNGSFVVPGVIGAGVVGSVLGGLYSKKNQDNAEEEKIAEESYQSDGENL